MAASAAMQSVIASPLDKTRFSTSSFPAKHAPSLKNTNMLVRCKAEGEDKVQPPLSKLNTPYLKKVGNKDESPLSEFAPPPSRKVSSKLFDVMSFAGPGPERINGRLAMLGFVSAMTVEVTQGQDLFSQIANGGYMWFLWTSILFTVASLIPFYRGLGPNETSDPAMTPDAELWNGRFAMLGIVALALTEYLKGRSLV